MVGEQRKTVIASACYGFPLSIHYQVKLHRDVWEEGKREKYCRTHLKLAVQDFRNQLIKALHEVGAK